MRKKTRDTLPSSPLAWRKFVRFRLDDPDQAEAFRHYFEERFGRLNEERQRHPNEVDRALAGVEEWANSVCDEAGLALGQAVSNDEYPSKTWYANQLRLRIAELRALREINPDEAVFHALYLGELIGEARAQIPYGRDAARGLRQLESARRGHEQVHGDANKKKEKWLERVEAFEKHRRVGHSKTVATSLAAEETGSSERSIFNARKRLS